MIGIEVVVSILEIADYITTLKRFKYGWIYFWFHFGCWHYGTLDEGKTQWIQGLGSWSVEQTNKERR